MGQVGVVATVGPDPGWTPEERARRREEHRWESQFAGMQSRLERIKTNLRAALEAGNTARAASLNVKAEEAERLIQEAKDRLNRMVN